MTSRKFWPWFWTFVIFVLCWVPKTYIPGQERLPKPLLAINFDKCVHLGIFAVFAVLWMRASVSKYRSLWILVVGLLLAVITEVGQQNRFVNRDANLADGAADFAGVVLGILACLIVSGFKTRSSETP